MMMKTAKIGFFVVCLFLVLGGSIFANLNQYYGIWRNVDPNGGITRIDIAKQGNKLVVHVWGKCHPKDCDWGKQIAYPYSASVGSSMTGNTQAVTAVYNTDFSQTILVIRLRGKRLTVEVFTRFTDGSGRNNYTKTHSFTKRRK